jgi:hypothetical protein
MPASVVALVAILTAIGAVVPVLHRVLRSARRTGLDVAPAVNTLFSIPWRNVL